MAAGAAASALGAYEHEELVPRRLLANRNVDLRTYRLGHAAVPIVGHDSDDGRPRPLPIRAAECKPLPDRIGAGEISRREGLIDHRNGRRLESIGRAHDAPRAQRHAQRFEVAGRRGSDERRRQRLTVRLAVFELELRAESCGRRELRRGGHRAHAWQCGEALRQPIEERAGGVAGVALARQRQAHREDTLRIEAAIDALDIEKAPEQQAGAEQQDDRQRELRDDEDMTKTPPAA